MTCKECLMFTTREVEEVTLAETSACINHLKDCESCRKFYEKISSFDRNPITTDEMLAAKKLKLRLVNDPET